MEFISADEAYKVAYNERYCKLAFNIDNLIKDSMDKGEFSIHKNIIFEDGTDIDISIRIINDVLESLKKSRLLCEI